MAGSGNLRVLRNNFLIFHGGLDSPLLGTGRFAPERPIEEALGLTDGFYAGFTFYGSMKYNENGGSSLLIDFGWQYNRVDKGYFNYGYSKNDTQGQIRMDCHIGYCYSWFLDSKNTLDLYGKGGLSVMDGPTIWTSKMSNWGVHFKSVSIDHQVCPSVTLGTRLRREWYSFGVELSPGITYYKESSWDDPLWLPNSHLRLLVGVIL
jgi:hypothetical protein